MKKKPFVTKEQLDEIIKKYPNQTDVPLWFGQTDRYMQRKGRV